MVEIVIFTTLLRLEVFWTWDLLETHASVDLGLLRARVGSSNPIGLIPEVLATERVMRAALMGVKDGNALGAFLGAGGRAHSGSWSSGLLLIFVIVVDEVC